MLTLFSFGYWGWGTSTKDLVRSVDAIEASRGFAPPLFIDIRMSHAAKAPGFSGNAFGKLLGADRYEWWNRLGNLSVKTGRGPRINISDPSAAGALLELAEENLERRNRRILFFCACQFPGQDAYRDNCHREVVGTLLLAAARRRGMAVEVVEWPGGDPRVLALPLGDREFRAVVSGRRAVPLGNRLPALNLLDLPWGSVCQFTCRGEQFFAVTGPATKSGGHWKLPQPFFEEEDHRDIQLAILSGLWWRRRYGLHARASTSPDADRAYSALR